MPSTNRPYLPVCLAGSPIIVPQLRALSQSLGTFIHHLNYSLFTLFGTTKKNLSLFHQGLTIFQHGFYLPTQFAQTLGLKGIFGLR